VVAVPGPDHPGQDRAGGLHPPRRVLSTPAQRIRLAVEDDLAAIVAIYNASIPGRLATADTEPVTVDARHGWFADHDPARRPLWVAEDEAGAVRAWASLGDFYGRPAYGATAEVSVYVAPDAQGLGLGRAMLAQAIAASPGLGVTTLLGFIFGHNAPSLGLFAAFGFARWGELPEVAVLDGVARDLVILGLRVA
jgi:L-amino acid N-acyltransferase YncA